MDACARPEPEAKPQQDTPPSNEPTTPEIAAPIVEPAPAPHIMRLAGVITTLAGLVYVGGGVRFSFDASDQANQLQRACATGCLGAAVASIDHAGKDADTDAAVLYIVGGAVVATGVTTYLWATLHARGEPPAVTATRGGAVLSASLRF